MNPLNHNGQINYQNNWYNEVYFNQQNYINYQMQMQAYQNNQNQQIFNAAKALGDYMDAAKQVDNEHQLELTLACLFMIGIKMGQ